MKILISGYTSRMTGSKRLKHDYITFVFLLEDILKEMGHQVERRRVTVGEQIRYVYDYAFCGVAPLSSISAYDIPQTHWLMSQLPGRCAILADDWSFSGFGKSAIYAVERWDKYCEYKGFNYDKRFLELIRRSIESMCTATLTGQNPPVIAPMFPWGDHNLILKENIRSTVHAVDPSPWVKYYTIKIPPQHQRLRQWVMAALSDHTAWIKRQRLNLPVYYVGNSRMSPGLILNEYETVQLFANSFGVLSTGYPIAGSGWWRTRYLNAVWAETPIYSDYRDAAIMGEAFQGKAEAFESELGLPAWVDRVEGQRSWLNANVGSKDKAKQTIYEMIGR